MTIRTLNRILIANRGEIALRVVRTVRDLGGASILPYTPEDLMSPAAELADEAHALPEGSSYTDADAILSMARATGADAVHPGYGFLSENDTFAQAVRYRLGGPVAVGHAGTGRQDERSGHCRARWSRSCSRNHRIGHGRRDGHGIRSRPRLSRRPEAN